MSSSVHDTLSAAGHAAADTLTAAAHAGGHAEGEGNLFARLLHHMDDSRELEFFGWHYELPQFPPVQIGGISIDLSITKHVFFLFFSAAIVALVAITAARKNARSSVPKGIGNLIEVFVVFIRDEMAIPNMGKGGVRYVSYLLTTFFFILVMNLLGLIPFMASSTSNINVTAGLAILAFIMIQVSSIKAQGLGHYLAHLTGGVHWSLWLIMIPIEVIGLFTKPFALCIRLWANMTGGHIVILALIGLILLFKSFIVAPVSVVFTLGINMLELFVAFLQAYIFTMLTSVFMGLGMQSGHDEHEAHA